MTTGVHFRQVRCREVRRCGELLFERATFNTFRAWVCTCWRSAATKSPLPVFAQEDQSKPVGEKQDDDDYQEQANETVAAVTEAVTGAAEAATETPEQEDDKNNDEDCSERHDYLPLKDH